MYIYIVGHLMVDFVKLCVVLCHNIYILWHKTTVSQN